MSFAMSLAKRFAMTVPRPRKLTGRSTAILVAWLAIGGGGACVSPDTFLREDGGGTPGNGDDAGAGIGGTPGGQGGTQGGGQGGMIAGGSGGRGGGSQGGSPGLGGAPGLGGRTGGGGSGLGGTIVIGPAANLTDNFETGDVNQRWLAPQSSDSTPCGTWAVVADGATNHVYQQSSTACTSSNPSWAAGGNITWTDLRLQAKVRFATDATTSTKITIGVRYASPKTVYFIEFTNNGGIKIRARTESSTTDVASTTSAMRVPVVAGQWVTLGLGVAGGTVSAYLGEDRTAPAILSGPATGVAAGGIALGVSNGTASFDDVLVTPQ
jgi:hypothetical protein